MQLQQQQGNRKMPLPTLQAQLFRGIILLPLNDGENVPYLEKTETYHAWCDEKLQIHNQESESQKPERERCHLVSQPRENWQEELNSQLNIQV